MNAQSLPLVTSLDPPPAIPEATSEQRTRTGSKRFLVVTLTVLVTLGALGFGTAWLLYRFDHIVVTDAVVRGRVHRIGARLDGQVKSIEVEPAQRVRKGDVVV